MKKKRSFAIKKLFPNFYKFQKNLINKIPVKISLWDEKNYNMNLRIHKMLKTWKNNPLIDEADIVYKNYNGGDVIDVGAYNGFYSFLLSPKANKNDNFICCEPDNNAHKDLVDNLSILKNHFKEISYSLITEPINNGKEVVISHDAWGHPCFLDAEKIKNLKSEQKKIKSTTIDNLVKKLSLKPSLVKIDTEGAEHDVLEGMKKTLKDFKPKIMLEKHPTMIPNHLSLDMIDNLLINNNYRSTLISNSSLAIREIWE